MSSQSQIVRAGVVTELRFQGMPDPIGQYTQIWFIRIPAGATLSEAECFTKVRHGFDLFNQKFYEMMGSGGDYQSWDVRTLKLLSDDESRAEPWTKKPGQAERLEEPGRFADMGITVMKGRLEQGGAIEIGWEPVETNDAAPTPAKVEAPVPTEKREACPAAELYRSPADGTPRTDAEPTLRQVLTDLYHKRVSDHAAWRAVIGHRTWLVPLFELNRHYQIEECETLVSGYSFHGRILG